MSTSVYTCEVCHKTMQSRNRKRHEQSKYHQTRTQGKQDCSICLDALTNPNRCHQCKQSWCKSCDNNIFKCPFCRLLIPGREQQSRQHDNSIINEYIRQDSMVPDQEYFEIGAIGEIARRVILIDFMNSLIDRFAR